MVTIIITALISVATCVSIAVLYKLFQQKETRLPSLSEDNQLIINDPLDLEIYSRDNELPVDINNEAITKLTQARDNFDVQKDRIDL